MASPAPAGAPLDFQVVPLAFNFDGLALEEGGVYAAVVRVDGADGARVPFGVATG